MSKIHSDKEKMIQEGICKRLSRKGYKYNIIDEENKDLGLNRNHKYLLIDSFIGEKNNFFIDGLKNKIERLNKSLIEEFSDVYSASDIVDIMLNDFVSRWNSIKNNADYYNLVFKAGYLTVELKDNNSRNVLRSYNVISFNRSSDNEYTIIKEKKMLGKKGVERPDFAMYINGIPLIVWEVKTKQKGLSGAISDYRKKETYNKFILCLGTDGEDVFLTGHKNVYFKWKKYGKNIKSSYVFDIENYIFKKERSLNDVEKIQNIIKNNIPKAKIDDLLKIVSFYDEDVKFDNLSSVLSKIVDSNSKNKMKLTKDLKDLLIIPTTGLEDIISELFDSPENLLFYFKYSVMLEKSDLSKSNNYENYFIINHRVQQYYTLKSLNRKLKYLTINNKDNNSLMSELVKHVQRSGKSITIRSSVNLIADRFQSLFKKLYVCVPDLTILNVMLKTFSNNHIKVKKITNRNEFVKSISESNASLTLYLYNIQKTKDPEDAEINSDDFINIQKKYNGNDVLFIIDEVHYAQSKTQADIRSYCFPNASFLTFTATPRIKEKSDSIVNETAIRYSESNVDGEIDYLDELNATDAIEMDIILPIVYEKMIFEQKANLQDALEFDNKTKDIVMERLKSNEYSISIEAEKEEVAQQILSELKPELEKNTISENKVLQEIENAKLDVENKYIDKVLKQIEKTEKHTALQNLRVGKIDYVIKDMNKKRETCYFGFRTKAFFVVESKKEAEQYIKTVRELSETSDNNYKGYRFGVDFSESQNSTSDVDLLIDLNGIKKDENIIEKFEEQRDDKDPIDILFIVNKYLMGYDNKELVAIYCDKVINETSKLYQLITRPATTREGKKQGFFVDLTFGNENYKTYTEKCLPYYNNNSGTSISTLKREEILVLKERLFEKISNIKKILGYKEKDLLLNELEIYNKLLSKGEKRKSANFIINKKVRYFNCFKEINEIMKALIKPKYYIENFEEILTLSKVNKKYLEENCPKNKESELEFDREQIESIIIESLNFFGYNDLNEINSFRVNGTKIKDQELSGRIEFNNVVNDFEQRLNFAKKTKPKGFSDLVSKWSDEIMSDKDAEIKINEFKEQFEKPFEENQKRITNKIKNEFNNSLSWYYSYESMKKAYSLIEEFYSMKLYSKNDFYNLSSFLDIELEKIFDNYIKEYSNLISKKIDSILNENSNELETKNFYINKIIKNCKIELKDLDKFSSIRSTGDLSIKDIKKLFWNDSKKLRDIMEQGKEVSDEVSEIVKTEKGNQFLWILFMFEDYYSELKTKSLDN